MSDLATILQDARDLADELDRPGHEVTPEERRKADALLQQASEAAARERQNAEDTARKDSLERLFLPPGPAKTKAVGPTGEHPWAKAVVATASDYSGNFKGLTPTGAVAVSSVLDPQVQALGFPTPVIAGLCTHKPIDTGSFTYWQESSRTFRAAPVAPGGTKPETDLAIKRIEDTVRTIAHLVSGVNRADLADATSLSDFIAQEMVTGLNAVLDNQIVSGDGTAPNLRGILATTGVLAVAYATDVVTTSRKGLTAIRNLGYEPTAFAFNPTDSEALDLLKDGQNRYYSAGPWGAGPGTLWGLTRVESAAVPAGIGIVGDWRKAIVVEREAATVDWNPYAGFNTNQVVFRAEERVGFALLQPAAFAQLDLTP
jgi:HK97 family phage major capsid protein